MPFSSVLGASSVIKPGVCTSTTRPTVPYEGQLIYETDTDRVASYNGSSWVYTAASGLVLVKTQTIGTAVSSVTVSDVFSSIYENYKIVISGGAGTAADTSIRMTLGSTNTGYYMGGFWTGASWTAAINAQRINNAAYFEAGISSTNTISADIELRNPNLPKVTEMFTRSNSTTTSGYSNYYAGYLNDTTQYTAFTIFPAVGTITGGTIRVYGYANS